MLARLGIRVVTGLVGAVVGLVLSAALLSGVSLTVTGLIQAAIVFWIIHVLVTFVALRALVREPTITRVVFLPMLVTIASLVICSILVSGLSIHGPMSYVWSGLILWACMAAAHAGGRRKLREQRRD
ncbi:MAG: hypothetical protein ACKOBG_01400 [Actinomycetota bacterium]